jgi:hypothetical protein
MFDHMRWQECPTDTLEQKLIASREMVSREEAEQLDILEELDRRHVATFDGARSLSDWVSARLDVSADTAKSLVRAMRRTAGRSDLRDALAGGVSFDRVEALSRIPEPVGLLEELDVVGVHRLASRRVGVTAGVETRNAEDRFMVLQPSLDKSWWKYWGGTDGYTGALMDKVLSEMADDLPPFPDGSRGDSSWRRATALVQLCVSDTPVPAQVTVFVDAREATASDGSAGVVLDTGPAIGRRALEAILCDAVTEVTVRAENGRYMDYGRKHRVVPPALRRALLDKYAGACAADGCTSRHRLQAHHVIAWSQGGRPDQDNLVLLCWFHHQVVVHERGFQIYEHPVHGRIRFRQPQATRGP